MKHLNCRVLIYLEYCIKQTLKANILEKENMCIISNCSNIKFLSNYENMLRIHSR